MAVVSSQEEENNDSKGCYFFRLKLELLICLIIIKRNTLYKCFATAV